MRKSTPPPPPPIWEVREITPASRSMEECRLSLTLRVTPDRRGQLVAEGHAHGADLLLAAARQLVRVEDHAAAARLQPELDALAEQRDEVAAQLSSMHRRREELLEESEVGLTDALAALDAEHAQLTDRQQDLAQRLASGQRGLSAAQVRSQSVAAKIARQIGRSCEDRINPEVLAAKQLVLTEGARGVEEWLRLTHARSHVCGDMNCNIAVQAAVAEVLGPLLPAAPTQGGDGLVPTAADAAEYALAE